MASFVRGRATGERILSNIAVPGARKRAILTEFSMPIALGRRLRKTMMTSETMTTVKTHPSGPKAPERISPVVRVRMTSAKVERRVVELTSLVFSPTILMALVAFELPPVLSVVRESGLTVRKVASTSPIQNETVTATPRAR